MTNASKSSIGDLIPNQSIISKEEKINESNYSSELIPIIKIERDCEKIEFFVKAKGHAIVFYKEKPLTKIGEIINDYIKKVKGKEEIKNSFYYDDNLIKNLDETIGNLGITTLSFIISN